MKQAKRRGKDNELRWHWNSHSSVHNMDIFRSPRLFLYWQGLWYGKTKKKDYSYASALL